MFKKTMCVMLSLAVLMLAVAGCGGPSVSKDFSAQIVTKAGGRTQSGKIYMSGDKWRMDLSAYGQKSTMIVRADKKVAYLLMPAQKMYMEQRYTDEHKRGMADMTKAGPGAGEVESQKVGSEKVSGILCDKYRITYKAGGRKTTVYQWISKDYLFPMKSAAADGSWSTEFKDFKPGRQPASLFELPAGYKKFEMPKMPF